MTTPSVHLIAVNLDLMGTDNRNKVVCTQNFLDRVQTEFNRAFTLRVGAETHFARVTVIHWIRPKKITEETLEGWLDESINIFDVGLGLQLWRDTSMHAEIVTVDIGGDWHSFKASNEELVDLLIMELLKDFGSECEVLSHSTRLVVATEHDYIARVVKLNFMQKIYQQATHYYTYLKTEKEAANLEREDTSVNIVAKEK